MTIPPKRSRGTACIATSQQTALNRREWFGRPRDRPLAAHWDFLRAGLPRIPKPHPQDAVFELRRHAVVDDRRGHGDHAMKWALHAFYEMNDGPRRSLRKLLGTLDCQHVSRDRNVDDGRLNSRQVDVDVDLR